MAKSFLKVSSPARLCLFGEHQDFLGLPVVAVAINRRFHVEFKKRPDKLFRYILPDLKGRDIEEDIVDPTKEITYRHREDFRRSSINAAKKLLGSAMDTGYDVTMHSEVPIRAGISSSSAMMCAMMKGLLALFGKETTPDEVARLAYNAEVTEFNNPGGMMDQFASAFGQLVTVDCRAPFKCRYLKAKVPGLILAHSMQDKETLKTLKATRDKVRELGARFQKEVPNYDLNTTPWFELYPLIEQEPEPVAGPMRGTIIDRDITQIALPLLEQEKLDDATLKRIGQLLTLHHWQLAATTRIDVSTPKLDTIVRAATKAGALGGKLVGSGGGGCLMFIAPGNEAAVIKAIEAVDTGDGKAPKAWAVSQDTGTRIDAEG